ncbi:hypothetical protein LCGC14_1929210, partial [marine sediment metagenome]
MTLYMDVDGTLIDGDDKPDWGVIGAVLQHHYEHSTAIVIWTGGGVGYAGLWCTRLFPRLPFAAAAVAAVANYASRIIEDRRKLSAQFVRITDVLCESDHWARRAKA